MKGILQRYIRMMDVLNKVLGYSLAVILSVMTVLIFWQVLARYVFGSSLAWSEELSRFLMILLVMFGASLALRKGRLISVDIVPELLGDKAKKWLNILTHLISFIFYLIMFVYGVKLAQNFANQIAPGTGISMYWIYLALPIGGVLFMLNSVACLLEEFTGRKE